LLDIFGFEIMEENGFEQLCINFANEKLQLYFNAEMLTKEQSEYAAEGVAWQQVEFRDNNGESVSNIRMCSRCRVLQVSCAPGVARSHS